MVCHAEPTTDAVVVSFLAMFGKVETRDFDFFADAETDNCLDDIGDDDCADHRQGQRDANSLQLFDPKRLADDVFDPVCFQVGVYVRRRQKPAVRQGPAESAAAERTRELPAHVGH